MTSKEALYLLMTNQKKVRDDFRFIDLNTHEKVSIEECYDIVIKDLEVLEIIKKNPEIVWWCCCYKTAEEMIIDRKGFMLDYSVEEIRKQFNKIKEWLEK